MKWIGEERVLDVGGDQFLVLLLVLDAEGDAAGGLVFSRVLQETLNGCIDVSAIGEDEVERGTRGATSRGWPRDRTAPSCPLG
jgi:hypothetical protein